MQKITPFLWFDDQAEEAMHHYVSIFRNSKVVGITRYGECRARAEGQRDDRRLRARGPTLHGPERRTEFTEAVSFVVNCETQEEVDHFWDKLGEGGRIQQCGWLKDKFGLSWQIVPSVLIELINDPDPEKSRRVTEAMLQMTKIDIAKLRQAYEGHA